MELTAMLKPHWYKVDWSLMVPVFLLIIIGIIMLMSTSSIVGFSNYNDAYFFIKRHLMYLGVGILACFVGMVTPHTIYKRFLGLLFVLVLVCLLLTLTPLGVKVGGAQRWLDIGVFRFQPVEILKFVVVVFIAVGLDRSQSFLNNFFKGCFPLLLVVSIPLSLVVLQPDLGNTAIILLVVGCLFFLSSMPLRHIVSLGGISFLAVCLIILSHSYQMQRILAFLNPWEDPLGKNYHIIQSLIAIGSGGFFGLGLGESKLKYFYLPLQYSDFIFSIICEEGGFIFAVLVLLLFVLILFKTFFIVKKSESQFSFFLGMGCGLLICVQALINIAVVIGLMPVTGLPLTFISFGGTSLITSLFYVGVILNISNDYQQKSYSIRS